MVYAVTGTRRMLTEEERQYIHRIIRRTLLARRRVNKLISGVQWGVDTESVLAVWGELPFENIILVTPGTAQHNWGLVENATRAGAQVIRSPTLHTASATYLKRDEVVVEQMGARGTLLAFPQRPTFYRSGTWATINRARKANRKVRIYSLDRA